METKKEAIRKSRVSTIIATLKQIKEKGGEVHRVRLIADIMYNYGVAKRTAIEYLQVAEMRV